MTETEKAFHHITEMINKLLISGVNQSQMNVMSDRLRKYLGDDSKVYDAFSRIDLNLDEKPKAEKEKDAVHLLDSALIQISENGLYVNYQLELTKLQAKDLRNKMKFFILGGIGGTVLTNAKEIYHHLQSLLQLIHK